VQLGPTSRAVGDEACARQVHGGFEHPLASSWRHMPSARAPIVAVELRDSPQRVFPAWLTARPAPSATPCSSVFDPRGAAPWPARRTSAISVRVFEGSTRHRGAEADALRPSRRRPEAAAPSWREARRAIRTRNGSELGPFCPLSAERPSGRLANAAPLFRRSRRAIQVFGRAESLSALTEIDPADSPADGHAPLDRRRTPRFLLHTHRTWSSRP